VKSKWPPGLSVPDVHAAVFDVLVCATASSFVHLTVVPGATVRGLGLNARAPSVEAPTAIDTATVPVAGAGDGAADGVVGAVGVDEFPPPHATMKMETIVIRPSRHDLMFALPPFTTEESNYAAVFKASIFQPIPPIDRAQAYSQSARLREVKG
jgi:hypothetical protein